MKTCSHCGTELQTEREEEIRCCYSCRRHGLLMGVWPSREPPQSVSEDKKSDGQPEQNFKDVPG